MNKKGNGLKGKKSEAAILLGMTSTVKATAATLGMSERQIYRWKKDDAFMGAINEYRNKVSAERLMTANRIVRQKFEADMPTKKDLLDWLKFASSETERIDYSDPGFRIPPEMLHLYMTKATVKSLERKRTADKRIY